MEIWKDIEGYENIYQVSNLGRVKSLKFDKVRILKLTPDKDGYLCVGLRNKIKRTLKVHRLVGKAFLIKNGLTEINHKDGNKINNTVDNLEWCTHKQNLRHAVDTGLLINASGEKQGISIFTQEQVNNIRERCSTKEWGIQAKIAREYNVDPSTINNIVRRKNWI